MKYYKEIHFGSCALTFYWFILLNVRYIQGESTEGLVVRLGSMIACGILALLTQKRK